MRSLAVVIIALALVFGAADCGAQGASSKTYLKMMEVQKLWDENRYPEALQELQAFSTRTRNNVHDHAVVHQYIAHTHVFMDQPDKAREALEIALALPDLTGKLTADLNLIYGQIVLGNEEFERARGALEYWFANTETERQPTHVFSLGYANYMTGNLARAEETIALAIGEAKTIRDSWYRLYYQVLFDQKKYRQAEAVLIGMLDREPGDADYWRLLANHYLQLENSKKALAAIAIGYNAGLLEDAPDLKRMIALYSSIEVPEKAARLLETHLADATLEEDPETLKRLGDLWLLSRERDNAKSVLLQAAEVAPDGRTYEMLGNIYFEDESWNDAHAAYLDAISQGGIDEPERLYLLAGISAQRGGMKDSARDAYNNARRSDKHRRQAEALLKRLDEASE